MVVVLNTSAFSALTRINGFEILRQMFHQDIVIPTAVLEEYSLKFQTVPSFIIVRDLTSEQKERARNLDLGKGEREAIILANDLKALLIIEDQKPRKVCEQMGINKAGTYGIVRVAFEDCILTRKEMVEIIEKLKKDLYYEEQLIKWVLSAQKPQPN
jgi:predicted nucleic acid-binding protein